MEIYQNQNSGIYACHYDHLELKTREALFLKKFYFLGTKKWYFHILERDYTDTCVCNQYSCYVDIFCVSYRTKREMIFKESRYNIPSGQIKRHACS